MSFYLKDPHSRVDYAIDWSSDLAGRTIEALALLAIGMTRLSMSPPSIGPIKEMILNLDLKPVQDAVAVALSDGANGNSIRELLTAWVERQNLPMG